MPSLQKKLKHRHRTKNKILSHLTFAHLGFAQPTGKTQKSQFSHRTIKNIRIFGQL